MESWQVPAAVILVAIGGLEMVRRQHRWNQARDIRVRKRRLYGGGGNAQLQPCLPMVASLWLSGPTE
jgi:hypothetical protein